MPNVVFGKVFNPLAVSLLKQDTYLINDTLLRIFDMYEELSEHGDDRTKDLLRGTLLQYLWGDKTTFDRASEMIGEHTKAV